MTRSFRIHIELHETSTCPFSAESTSAIVTCFLTGEKRSFTRFVYIRFLRLDFNKCSISCSTAHQPTGSSERNS